MVGTIDEARAEERARPQGGGRMRLLITTPTAVVVDERDVVAVRAEDESGGFGILDGPRRFPDRAHRLGRQLAATATAGGATAPCAAACCR